MKRKRTERPLTPSDVAAGRFVLVCFTIMAFLDAPLPVAVVVALVSVVLIVAVRPSEPL